jgi:hypothetical protein
MTFWTPKLVEARLSQAVSRLGRPSQRVPDMPCPYAVDASKPEGALLWLLWLEPEDAQLLWMKVESRPWKEICRHCGISRATANRRVEYLLSVLAWRLNHRHLPEKWSCRYLVERTREISRGV